MALDDTNGSVQAVMPVAPTGGGYSYPAMPMMNGGGFGNGFFGGDSAWLLLLILLCGGGWGGLGGFGMGGMMWPMMAGGMGAGFGLDYLYPWLNNSQHISDGFRDQQLNTAVQGLQSAVTSGFGDVQLGIAGVNQNVSNVGAGIQQSLCNGFSGVNLGMANGFAGVNQAIANSAAQGEIAANSRHSALTGQLFNSEINALNRSFAEQTANAQGFNGLQSQLAQCCCDNRLDSCQTRNTIQAEGASSRYEAANNTRDIITAQTASTQAILDKLCQLELDGVKGQLAQAQRENVALQNAVNMATMQASQVAQTAELRAAQATTANQLVSELRSCPIPAQPVYGNQPIFSCPQNAYNGCGCGQ